MLIDLRFRVRVAEQQANVMEVEFALGHKQSAIRDTIAERRITSLKKPIGYKLK